VRQADIERGRTYINWPETATRTVTRIRGGIIYFAEVRHDWRPTRDRCRFERFAGWAKRQSAAPRRGREREAHGGNLQRENIAELAPRLQNAFPEKLGFHSDGF